MKHKPGLWMEYFGHIISKHSADIIFKKINFQTDERPNCNRLIASDIFVIQFLVSLLRSTTLRLYPAICVTIVALGSRVSTRPESSQPRAPVPPLTFAHLNS